MSLTEFFFWGGVVWCVYNVLKAYIAASVINAMPSDLFFPIKLEYDNNQWFAWDYNDEFLGQAATRQGLLDLISENLDYPKDKFTIISEQSALSTTAG